MLSSRSDCRKSKEVEVKALEIYGRNIGYAFQIIDDILDL